MEHVGMEKRLEIEREEYWSEWSNLIPFIPMKEGWQVSVIPPYAWALSRFLVKRADGVGKSVYLDGYDRLGAFGEPYWEVYPVHGDVGRCRMEDTDELIALIEADVDDSTDLIEENI